MKKIIFVLFLGAIIAPMFIKGPDGEPIMSISDWIPEKPDVSSLSSSSEGQAAFYRYQDAEGNWQYTDRPPEGVNAELVEVNTNANVIQSVEAKPKETARAEASAPGVAGYVDNMKDVMQDAEDVQKLMDDREGQLQEALSRSQ